MKSFSRFVATHASSVLVCVAAFSPAFSAQAADPSFAKTQYPIVLVHGLFGFSSVAGVDYFFRIPAELRANGATVLVASVSAVNSPEVRGEQLLLQMKQWAAAKGYKKFNLVGHSLGAPTARYVAGVAPSMVASVTSVGGTNDLSVGGSSSAVLDTLLGFKNLANVMGKVIGAASGSAGLPQDEAALKAFALDTPGFNRRFPAGQPTSACGQGPEQAQGIFFYSATGNKPKTNFLDLSDVILVANRQFATDGLVPVCAAHWGKVVRDDFPWNHLDEVNQVLGLRGSGPDPVAFYVSQANRLKGKGL